ncbi:hypothetical protein AF72_10830 [Xylella taiwanensis]|uniref:Uncharacterized protein n=1 Tax=Xylella taiwanensis TaxID=1444770 RepID=Z9JGY3_9GAMM|nr:hypothetical protein AF72_10830 [Xylella taiwanensis]
MLLVWIDTQRFQGEVVRLILATPSWLMQW